MEQENGKNAKDKAGLKDKCIRMQPAFHSGSFELKDYSISLT